MKKIFAILLTATLFSCNEFRDKKDFRNYLRDQHPYCELREIDIAYDIPYQYIVFDTLNNQAFIYTSRKDIGTLKKFPIIGYNRTFPVTWKDATDIAHRLFEEELNSY